VKQAITCLAKPMVSVDNKPVHCSHLLIVVKTGRVAGSAGILASLQEEMSQRCSMLH